MYLLSCKSVSVVETLMYKSEHPAKNVSAQNWSQGICIGFCKVENWVPPSKTPV